VSPSIFQPTTSRKQAYSDTARKHAGRSLDDTDTAGKVAVILQLGKRLLITEKSI
jgi:hypothetical protein